MPKRSIPLALAIACLARLPVAGAEDAPTTPGITIKGHSGITNITADGQLAATRELDCIGIDQVQATFTPPDLFTGVKHCAERGDYDAVVRLDLMAFAFARFDALRVADVSAHDAAQALNFEFAGSLSAEQRARFAQALTAFQQDASAHQAFCDRLARLGPPDYVPTYMILHGANQLVRRLSHLPEPANGPLVPDFDAKAAWDRVEKTYIHCS